MVALCELQQLTHFYGRTCALRDVTLTVQPGAVGLVGQNGAGKSTLMQIMLGLIRPTRGRAKVLGKDAARAGVPLRGVVGYMPERGALVPGLTGIEYVALAGELCGMPRREAMRRSHEALTYLDLEDARYRKIEQYSVGMTQRLKLAATIVHDPLVLLLDEPTAGLDPEGRAAMPKLLSEYAAIHEKSLILSTHLLGDIERVCSTTVILDQGKVKGVGRIEQLRESRRRRYRLRWQGAGAEMLGDFRQHGVEVKTDAPGEALLTLSGDLSPQLFYERASARGVFITHLAAEEEDLEAIYHRLIRAGEAP